MTRKWIGGAIFGAVASFYCTDAAAEETLLLRYRAPAECPSSAEFRSEVRAVLKSPDNAPRGVPVKVVIASGSDGYQLTLHVRDDSREMTGAQCADLVSAAALFLALLIEEPAFGESEAPAPTEAPEPESAPAPVAELSESEGAGSGAPLRFYAGLSGGIDAATLPQMGALASARFGMLGRRFLIEAQAFGLFPQQSLVEPERSLETALVGAGVKGCRLARPFEVGFFSLCAGLSSGALFVSSPEATTQAEAAPAFVAADFSSEFWLFASDDFAVTLGGALSQPLLAPVVVLRGGGESLQVYQMGTSFSGQLGMRVLF